jgi:hypothetical protein
MVQTDSTVQPFNHSTNKKPSFHKSRNEGIKLIRSKNGLTGWPHPSLCGEVAEAVDG